MSQNQPNTRWKRILRTAARIYAGLAAGLILLLFIGEGWSEGFGFLLEISLRESLMLTVFALVWVGLLLGWKWELLGGILTLGGMLVFYLLDYTFSGTFPRGPFFILLAGPGLLNLTTGLLPDQVSVSE